MNSPPGPLQHSIKEAELTDWQDIDWTTVIVGPSAQRHDLSNEVVSWTGTTTSEFGNAFSDALTSSRRDYGGYGLLCLYPVLFVFSDCVRVVPQGTRTLVTRTTGR